MISLRVLRRLEMVKLLSIRRFQKLLAGYFIIAGLIVLTYVYLYETEGSSRQVLTEVKGLEETGDVITGKLDHNVNIDVVNDKPETVIDTLHGGEEENKNLAAAESVNISSEPPDYLLMSVTYTEDYNPTPPEQQTTQVLHAVDGQLFPLDKNGGIYEDILADYEDESLYEIPHILHQTSDTDQVPAQTAVFMKSWTRLNPFWVHWFWTDRGFVSMLLRHYPEYYDVYRKYGDRFNRADMRKYFLLYREGGIVADLDVECIRHFDDAMMDSQCILAREPEVHRILIYGDPEADYITPVFMACRAGHPFMKFLINNLRSYVERLPSSPSDQLKHNQTGTLFLTEMFDEYKRQGGGTDVYLAPAEFFMPAYNPSYETWLRVKCNGYKLDASLSDKQKAMCETLERTEYRNFNLDNSYVYKHWLQTRPPGHIGDGPDIVSVTNVLPSVALFNR